MWPIPNMLAIFGSGPHVADLVLRKVFKFEECSGPVVIMDYSGRGAMILNRGNIRRPLGERQFRRETF